MVKTSACALRLFLIRINCHEPGLLDIIKSFIFIYREKLINNYNNIALYYFNMNLSYNENSLINWIYYASKNCDIKEEQISMFHQFINGNLKPYFLKHCIKAIKEETESKEGQNYKRLSAIELMKLRDIIGLYHIMTTNQMIKDINFMYIYNITLQTRRIEQTLNNTDYLKQKGIFETTSEYPLYTKKLKDSLTKTRNTIDGIIAKIENTERECYSNYVKEIMKKIEEELTPMLM